MQKIDQCHKEYLILDQQISTPTIVKNLVEFSKLNFFVDEVSLLQRKDDSILAELNAHVSSITSIEDRVSSLDELYM